MYESDLLRLFYNSYFENGHYAGISTLHEIYYIYRIIIFPEYMTGSIQWNRSLFWDTSDWN